MKKNFINFIFNNFQKNAFTLAEMLIVVSILGVISALTIPGIVGTVDNQKYVMMVKSSYSSVESAYHAATAEHNGNMFYGVARTSNAALANTISARLFNQMNVDYNCGNTSSNYCFINSASLYCNGTSSSINFATNTDYYKVILEDSTSIGVSCVNTTLVCNVVVDLDGPKKGFNTLGIDLFAFVMTPEKFYFANSTAMAQNNVTGCRNGNVMQCAAWVMRFGNLDYLDCATKLNVSNGTTSCN